MKVVVFWVVAPCTLVDTDQHLREAYFLHHYGDDHSDDEGSKFLCLVVGIDSPFRGSYCLHHQGVIILVMEAVNPSETLVNIYQTAWCNVPADSHFH
jgi:hypothetical protein